jgi:hypothetical protein
MLARIESSAPRKAPTAVRSISISTHAAGVSLKTAARAGVFCAIAHPPSPAAVAMKARRERLAIVSTLAIILSDVIFI